VFESRLLRKIFGAKRDELIGGRRKLQNEELRGWFCSSIIISLSELRQIRWAGHVASMWEKSKAHRILVGKLKICEFLEDLAFK
jgi:hypothetical protein